MSSRESNLFTARDLATILRINPFLVAFGGHSVVPHNDVVTAKRPIQFVTQLRDPIKRAVSQYRFWNSRMALDTDWQAFLRHPVSSNFQVKKIAGCEDLAVAKEYLSQRFLLVGTVENFDIFLVLLAGKLGLPLELFTYRRKNAAGDDELEMPPGFVEGLRDRNSLDQQLYDWVDAELLPGYTRNHATGFESDLSRFRQLQQLDERSPAVQGAVDFVYRNGYLKPLSGLIRLLHGLPYQGSYSVE